MGTALAGDYLLFFNHHFALLLKTGYAVLIDRAKTILPQFRCVSIFLDLLHGLPAGCLKVPLLSVLYLYNDSNLLSLDPDHKVTVPISGLSVGFYIPVFLKS